MTAYPKPRPAILERKDRKRDRETAWQRVRKAVLARDHWTCRLTGCGAHLGPVEVHHVKARSLGREDSTKNCMVTCRLHHGLMQTHVITVEPTTARGCDGPLRFDYDERD